MSHSSVTPVGLVTAASMSNGLVPETDTIEAISIPESLGLKSQTDLIDRNTPNGLVH